MDVPRIKKRIGAFLLGEEGKISKQSLLKTGIIIGSLAVATTLAAKSTLAHSNHYNANCACGAASGGACHDNGMSPPNYNQPTIRVQHGHCSERHSNHSSHSSHSSHCSHSSHGHSW